MEALVLLSVASVLTGSSTITGTVWNDQNGDGARQPAEPGVAGQTVYLDLNHDHQDDSVVTTVDAPSTAIGTAPGQLGAFSNGASTLQVQGFPTRIVGLQVNLDLANNGDSPVTVGIVSPLGLTVPQLPTLFTIQPGEHFVGSFNQNAANPVTLAARPLAPGSYQPQQAFTSQASYIYNGDPNGTWGLVFFGDTSGLSLNSWSLSFQLADPTATTDANGSYTFTGIAAGSYDVETLLAPGDVQTSPTGAGASQSVSVATGQTASGINFGVQPASHVTSQSLYLSSAAAGWGQNITVNYTLANQGNGDAGAFDVGLYLSSNGVIGTSGILLTTLHFNGLASHATVSGSVNVLLPAQPAGFGALTSSYVGFVVDPAGTLAHNNPAGKSNQGPGIDLTALAAPTNTAVTTGSSVQQDPSIAVDPTNANHLVTAYMDYSLVDTGYAGIGVAVSYDAGATWTHTEVPLPVNFTQGAADPTVQFDATGKVYVSFMSATFLGPDKPGLTNPDSTQRQFGFESNNGIFVASSSDGGNNWSQPVALVSHTYSGTQVPFEIAPDFAVDTYKTLPNGQANPYYGDLYVAWVRLYPSGQFPGQPDSTGGSDVMFSVSSDGGKTWTTQMQTDPNTGLNVSVIKDPDFGENATSDPGHGFVFYPEVSIGPQGDIYVSTYGASDFTVYHSVDNGASFRAPVRSEQLGVPFTAVLPYPNLGTDSFRTNSVRDIVADPAHPGRVYVAEANQVANNGLGGTIDAGEVIFAYSNDYGLTWTTLFQVGNETSNLASLPTAGDQTFLSVLNDDDNGNDLAFATLDQLLNQEVISGQALPSLAVDAKGNLTVIWYDTRRDPLGQNLDVFGIVSTDGGKTFTPNFRISDTSFNPNSGTFTDATGQTNYYLGDKIGVVAANGVAYAVWTDTRNSDGQQIYFQSYSLTPAPAPPLSRLSPNNTPETATYVGQISAQLAIPKLIVGPANDNWFSFQAGASGDLVVSAQATTGGANLQVALTDAEGNPLPATVTPLLDSNGNVVGSQVVYASVAGETYLVHVSGANGATVSYALSLGALTGDLGSTVQGTVKNTVDPGGDSIYRLEVGVTGTLALTLTPGFDALGGLTLQILSSNGQTVLAVGPGGGSAAGVPQTLSVPVTKDEVLLISIASADGVNGGSFQLVYTNLDQYETPGNQTLFYPTTGSPSSVAVASLAGPNSPVDIIVSSTDVSDPVNVLDGNSDGTFQAPRQFDVGPGLSGALTAGNRQIGVVDLTGDGIPDLIIPNFRAGDVSVLVGNGDGTFQPQRRFDAISSPDSLMTGDFNNDGKADVAVLENFPQLGGVSQIAILLGRGDGTFMPAETYSTVFSNGAGPMVVGDFTGNGLDDIIVFSKNQPQAQIFLGNPDGTFRNGGVFATGENVFAASAVDLDHDGKLDLVTTGTNNGNVYIQLGNGDGTFGKPQAFTAMAPRPGDNVGVNGLAIADFGSPGGIGAGSPDGNLDLIVTAASRSGQGTAEVIMLPGLVDANGKFAGFGAPVVLANVGKAGQVATGDFTHNGATDIVVTDVGGVTVIYGSPPPVAPNTTVATARDLGNAVHVVTQPQAIVTGHEDAYYTFTVPIEAATDSGNEVVDFSALFQDIGGAGLQMQVLDAAGNVLGSGERFRVVAAQGETLTIHVSGLGSIASGSDADRGFGVYTLDIDVLPQVVSVQAQSLLSGGPATSIVITLQGDRLDPTAAQDPSNYTVLWFPPQVASAAPVGQVIPISATANLPVIYNSSADVEVSSGLHYQTAARQTITLLFDQTLPAGTYEVILSSKIQAAAYGTDENSVLVADNALGGHSIVSVKSADGTIANGSDTILPNFVAANGTPGGFDTLGGGTPFLTQLQNDLQALVDTLIAKNGNDPSITKVLNDQILARFAPLIAAAQNDGRLPQAITIVWFDPVSIGLQSPQGGLSYSESSNAVSSSLSNSFVSVGGNVELIVMANPSGTASFDVGNVTASAQGGAVVMNGTSTTELSLTEALQSGQTSFSVTSNDSSGGSNGSGPGTSTTSEGTGGSGGGNGSSSSSVATFAVAMLSGLIVGSNSTVASPSSSSSSSSGGPGQAILAGQPDDETSEEIAEKAAKAKALIQRLLSAVDEALDGLLGDEVAQSDTTRTVLQVIKQASVVRKALGLDGQPIEDLLWENLVNLLNRRGQNPAAIGAGNGAAGKKTGQKAPDQPVDPAANNAPLPKPNDVKAAAGDEVFLWDSSLEGLLAGDGIAEPDDTQPGAEACWAALFMPFVAYQVRARRIARREKFVRRKPQEPSVDA